MSFGWSAGNVVECVKLFARISKAQKDSDGSETKYQNAEEFLRGIERTIKGVEDFLQKHPEAELRTFLEENAESLSRAVTRFREKIEPYDASLGVNATSSEAKKAFKKIKLELFGHIDELQHAVSHPQQVLDSSLLIQNLEMLHILSSKPTVSPQQFLASTEDILEKFNPLEGAIENLRIISEDFITVQQTSEDNRQRNFDQLLQNLSERNNLQNSITAQAQADADAQDLWRSQIQVTITETKAEVQSFLEELQQMRQVQESRHSQTEVMHWVRSALQILPWSRLSQPATPRPIFKIINRTIIANPGPAQAASTRGEGSSQRGISNAFNSQGGSSRKDSPRGGSQATNSRVGESSKGNSAKAIQSQGESSKGKSLETGKTQNHDSRGSNSQTTNLRVKDSNGGPSRGENSQSANSRGGISNNGSSRGGGSAGNKPQNDKSHEVNSRESSFKNNRAQKNGARGRNSARGGNRGQRGGSTQGGRMSRGGGVSQGSGTSRGGRISRGASNTRGGGGGNPRGSSNAPGGYNSRGGGNARGGSDARGGSVRGKSSTRGGSSHPRGGARAGGNVRGKNVRGGKA